MILQGSTTLSRQSRPRPRHSQYLTHLRPDGQWRQGQGQGQQPGPEWRQAWKSANPAIPEISVPIYSSAVEKRHSAKTNSATEILSIPADGAMSLYAPRPGIPPDDSRQHSRIHQTHNQSLESTSDHKSSRSPNMFVDRGRF
jgi:hypothetical protein